MTHFFHLYFELYSLVYFISAFQDNTHLHAKNDTFKLVNIDILFYVKFANLWYITCFIPNLTPIWPLSHGLGLLYKAKHYLNEKTLLPSQEKHAIQIIRCKDRSK